ncbi:hypothetical protein QYE76_032130 [Lolium multiflorum]|uniref:Transposase (putative) gypsy type domain-containing protein n=1 Tax=Lolium multiflorum TaxID=4521 RepID=A0AAD8QV74_LOLMU|nr:hypothetical protein QYE76_032130 [Lolium multiflorum]
MSTEEYMSEPAGSNLRSETPSVSFGEQISAGQMESSSNAPEAATGRGKEASSSGQGSGVDLSTITRGAGKGLDVTQPEIDWLYRSRRVPAEVSCRLPRDEVEPVPEPGEFVVFLAHFDRGFGLPASNFFRQFLDFYQLQPHHLPGNAIFYLSCYATFMEGYIGLRPTRETFARFFCLRINSVQGKNIPKPKPPVQCGSCIIGSCQGCPFFKFSGLESCRAWQETFFYVKNKGAADFINLPAYQPGTPTRANWSYQPGTNHIETNRIVRFMEQLMKDTNICSDDIIRTFISRRVLPLQRRSHKISEMCGPRDPTKITGLPLSKEDVVLKARQICQTDMPMDWEWGFLPLSSTNPPTDEARERFPRIAAEARGPCRKSDVDKEDPDPYVPWKELKMGRTHTPRPGNFSTNDSDSDDEVTVLEAEVGQEFLEKLASQGKKNKAPAPEAGSSHAPPAKRARQEIGGKVVTTKRYRKHEMPVASGAALKITKSASGMRPESSEDAAQASPPPHASPAPSGAGKTPASSLGGNTSTGRAAPKPSDHRAEENLSSPPEAHDTGARNIGANTEDAGRVEPLVPAIPKKKKKKTTASSPSKSMPDSSAPASSSPAKDAPEATASPKTTPTPPPASSAGEPATAKPPTPPAASTGKPASSKPTPPEGAKLTSRELTAVVTAASSPSSGPQSLVLHAGRAAVAVGETALAHLGRITELNRGGADLGHLLDYSKQWNQADLSPATHGLGKDKLPAIDPAGPRSTGQHFGRLLRAVKEFDTAWHDANNNGVSTLDARKRLFEELLWEHRDLAEAHSKCQALPEATFEDLRGQIAALKAEKEQLVLKHREALSAQETISAGLKDELAQAELRHDRELKEAKAAAEAKLDETLKEFTDSTAVLRAELEEQTGAQKAAQERIATLTTDQTEYDRLVMQTDALAVRLFPDSQQHEHKKVMERRAEQAMSNPEAAWDAYDHLVAFSARIQHMRAVDRHLVDLPDVAIKIFKVLWPGEEVPANLTLTSDRLKDAGRRIREWQCLAAHAGADAALRIACSWYEDLDLEAFHSLHRDAPTDKDPVLTAKRKDRAYRIAEYAPICTFIPPPPDVKDYLSDNEEEDVDDEEIEEAGEDEVPPEQAPETPEAGDAPPEAPEAGAQPPAV